MYLNNMKQSLNVCFIHIMYICRKPGNGRECGESRKSKKALFKLLIYKFFLIHKFS